MRKFADFTLYILKCRVVPSFIHLVISAMFIWTYSYVSYSMQLLKYLFCLICLRDTEAWILELSISIFFENFYENWAYLSKECLSFTTPVNTQDMTICPLHRERLGIGWSEVSNTMWYFIRDRKIGTLCHSYPKSRARLYVVPVEAYITCHRKNSFEVGNGCDTEIELYVKHIIVRYSLISCQHQR